MMNKQWISLVAAAALTGLSGCGGGSDSGSTATDPAAAAAASAATTAPALDVINTSGSQTSIIGTWKSGCYSLALGSPDVQDTYVFTGQLISFSMNQYTTTDLSCGGTMTEVGTVQGSISKGINDSIVSWVDSTDVAAAAPNAQAGGGVLTGTEMFTKVDATIISVTGLPGQANPPIVVSDVVDFSLVVDATGTLPVAYKINYAMGSSTGIANDMIMKQ